MTSTRSLPAAATNGEIINDMKLNNEASVVEAGKTWFIEEDPEREASN